MFSTFDLCLLLYVIRLAGWLKHCNLSLSLSLSLSLCFSVGLQSTVRTFVVREPNLEVRKEVA